MKIMNIDSAVALAIMAKTLEAIRAKEYTQLHDISHWGWSSSGKSMTQFIDVAYSLNDEIEGYTVYVTRDRVADYSRNYRGTHRLDNQKMGKILISYDGNFPNRVWIEI